MKFSSDEEMRILKSSRLEEFLPPGALAELRARYNEPHRRYHNWDHALHVLSWVNQLAENDMAMKLAALYHDAIYVVGAPNNEERSAELMRKHLDGVINEIYVSDAVIRHGETRMNVDEAARYIALTARHGKLNRKDVMYDDAVFLDCDLSNMAEPRFDLFEATNDTVEAELRLVYTSEQIAEGRKTFLGGLIDGRNVFLTDLFDDKQAKANIRRLLAK